MKELSTPMSEVSHSGSYQKTLDFEEKMFIKFLTDGGVKFGSDMSVPLNLGYSVCGSYAANLTSTQIINTMTENKLSEEDAVLCVSAALVLFCPEFKDRI